MTPPDSSSMQMGDILDTLREVRAEAAARDRNEADTRHKIIDFILHDLLAWPRNRVDVEEHIHPGFADYVLKKPTGDPLIIIEAKKEGVYFELPVAHDPQETSCFLSVEKLITDEAIKAAILQVRRLLRHGY